MADRETQGQEDAAWWAFDDFADSSLPSATFDEPLVWPESPAWDGQPANGNGGESLRLPEQTSAASPAEFDGTDIFPPEPGPAVIDAAPPPDLQVQWQATDDDPAPTAVHREPLAGLGGGTTGVAHAGAGKGAEEPLDESIWADTPRDSGDIGLISTSAHSASPVYPATDGPDRPWWRRVDIRSGNAAMIGLISLVSLVLLGMFLSVRARNDVPTDSSQTRRPSNDIAVTGPLTTVPLTTTVTTTAPAPAINIADLLPTDDAAAAPTETTTGAAGPRSPATTAAPARTTGSGGGGGGGGGATTPATSATPAPTSPPATSPPDTSPPDTSPPGTSPPATSPPPDDTQPPPTRRTTTSITFPSFPGTSSPPSPPAFTIPTFPGVND